MQLTKSIKWNADDIDTKQKKNLKELLISASLFGFIILFIILGYIVYVIKTQYLISQHRIMHTIVLKRDGYTPLILADKYIDDVSKELGARIIKAANNLDSINQVLPAGMTVKIPNK
jgi:hypothetical protein